MKFRLLVAVLMVGAIPLTVRASENPDMVRLVDAYIEEGGHGYELCLITGGTKCFNIQDVEIDIVVDPTLHGTFYECHDGVNACSVNDALNRVVIVHVRSVTVKNVWERVLSRFRRVPHEDVFYPDVVPRVVR